MTKFLVCVVALLGVVAFGRNNAYAQTVTQGGTAASFVPSTSSDFVHITYGATSVYNTDSSYHYVVAQMGVLGGPGTYTYHVYGYFNGTAMQCFPAVTSRTTGSTTFGTTGTSATSTGFGSFSTSITLPTGPGFVSMYCYLPPNASSFAYLYGWTT